MKWSNGTMTDTNTKTSIFSGQLTGFRTRGAVSMLAGLSLAALVAACNTAPPPKAEGKQLSAAEMQALYMSGTQTVSQGTSLATGREWIITRDGTGTQSLALVSSDYTDTGTYRVDGAMVCSKWVKRSDETCAQVFQLPDGKYQAANEKGEMLAEFTVSTGS